MSAGKTVRERTQAKMTPIAVKLPKSARIGTAAKLSVKKPTPVVALVIKIGALLSYAIMYQ